MSNRSGTVETEVAAVAASEEKYPNRYKPGQSGNPAGRPKKTREEEALLEQLKQLTPLALEKMKGMLENDRVAALAKVRIIEIILERTFGKVENPVKVTNAQESIEQAQAELDAIFASYDDTGSGAVSLAGSDPLSGAVPVAGGEPQ